MTCLSLGLGGCDRRSPTEPCIGPLPVTGSVMRPIRISGPTPQYTEEARRARIQGTVVVQATIDCEGRVTNVTVLQSLPLGLTESAVDAISQWVFEPATLDGEAVSVFYDLSVNFRLQ